MSRENAGHQDGIEIGIGLGIGMVAVAVTRENAGDQDGLRRASYGSARQALLGYFIPIMFVGRGSCLCLCPSKSNPYSCKRAPHDTKKSPMLPEKRPARAIAARRYV